jgi:hypothetical protein
MPPKFRIIRASSPISSSDNEAPVDTFKPHPKYSNFFGCEETGKIIHRKENGKERIVKVNKIGYIQFHEHGSMIYQSRIENVIADIFNPEPPRTVKMESRAEVWKLKVSEDYDKTKNEGYIPPRYLEWIIADESRRKGTSRTKTQTSSKTGTHLENITNAILRPTNGVPNARRPSVSSQSTVSDDTYGSNEQFEYLQKQNLELEEQNEILRSDIAGLIRQQQMSQDELLDAEKDNLKGQIRKMFDLLDPETRTNLKLQLSRLHYSYRYWV